MLEFNEAHFVGIGGAGMSGIAKILLELGYKVSGSDLYESERTMRLRQLGARIFIGHDPGNIDDPDVVVISSAVPETNVELQKARGKGIPVVGRGEMLGWIMSRQTGIAIAGTHGKTTTTSMVGLILDEAGLEPTIVVGGELNDIGSNARLGRGKYFVAEADESDSSFLLLNPTYSITTNIEADHLDHYHDIEDIVQSFGQFVGKLPAHGCAVLNADDDRCMRIRSNLSCGAVTFGLRNRADYTAEGVGLSGMNSRCEVIEFGRSLGTLELNVPGMHNVANALAAIALTRRIGVEFSAIKSALNRFSGAHRRFQVLGESGGVLVVDDYAHHPSEISATLQAAVPLGRRIVAVFQPHRYTRTKFLKNDFAKAFGCADEVVMTDIYSALESPDPEASAGEVAELVGKHKGKPVHFIPDKWDIVEYLLELCRPGDLVLFMGAGDIRKVGERFAAELVRRPLVPEESAVDVVAGSAAMGAGS